MLPDSLPLDPLLQKPDSFQNLHTPVVSLKYVGFKPQDFGKGLERPLAEPLYRTCRDALAPELLAYPVTQFPGTSGDIRASHKSMSSIC